MAPGLSMEASPTLPMKRQNDARLFVTNNPNVSSSPVSDSNHLLATYSLQTRRKPTGQDIVSTLRNLHNLSLSDELSDSCTGTGAINLQTIHNRVDSDELHLHG